MLNPREELMFLLRGFFATPLLTALGKQGVLDKFENQPVSIDEIGLELNKNFMQSAFVYLESIGLLYRIDQIGKTFQTTSLGAKIFKRYGSFVLLYSYRDLISDVEHLLFDTNATVPKCDRLDNVIGSGLTNGRKFFPTGLESVKNLDVSLVVDLACGDGEFLLRFHEAHPNASIVAADLSPIAIESTKSNFKEKYPSLGLATVETDAKEVSKWMAVVDEVRSHSPDGKMVISMWYLVHEIAEHDVDIVAEFLNSIHEYCPDAHLLIGEIINVEPELLTQSCYGSIMPEFLFFHELSGQGVLTWYQYQQLLQKIPYELAFETQFDLIGAEKKRVPSAIVWRLSPQ